jgi:predicted PurR-regulated permease PerM
VAAIIVFVAAIAAVVLLSIAVFPFVSAQVSGFAEEWPAFRAEVVTIVQDTAQDIEDRFGAEVNTSAVSCLLGDVERADGEDCDTVTEDLRERITGQVGRITEIGLGVLEGALVFIIAPLLALYMLIDLPQLQRDLLNLFPESHRIEAADVGSKVGRAVGGFFRGQLFVALTVGVMSAVGFKIVGLPFWLVIGAIAGFFNLIPLVGPFIGGTIGFFVGTVSGGIGLGLRAAIVELIVQQLDNHLISPLVMRRAVQLHPATVLLALLAGGTIAGFWGLLLGVPAVAAAKLLLGHLWATRVLGEQVTPFASMRRGGAPPSVVPTPAPKTASDEDEEPSAAPAPGKVAHEVEPRPEPEP